MRSSRPDVADELLVVDGPRVPALIQSYESNLSKRDATIALQKSILDRFKLKLKAEQDAHEQSTVSHYTQSLVFTDDIVLLQQGMCYQPIRRL